MRFGLDARLGFYDRGGIGRYIRCLASALEQECAPDTTAVVADFRDGEWGGGAHGVIGPARSTRLDWLFALQAVALRLDLIHYPDHVIPRPSPGKSVVTVHDVSFWRMPETHSPASLAYYERCRDSVRRADAVICGSEFTREELLVTTDVEPGKVFTSSYGLEARFAPAGIEEQARVRERYGLGRPYVLFVGTIGLRKNLVRLVEDCASCELYSLLKRPDEKHVTEAAFDNPVFVEDLVRAVAERANEHERITWYRVEAENFESIHNHNAWAMIEKDKR